MRDTARWIGSFVLVLAAHAAAVGAALGWRAEEAPYSPPPAAVMLEMAPLPAAPETTPNDAPPAPDLSEMVPEPQEPPPVDLKPMKIELAEAEPPPPVEILPPDKVAIVLPDPEPPPPVDLKPPPPKPQPVKKPKPVEKRPPAPAAAPQATPDQAPRAAAPVQGATPYPPSSALPTWKGLLLRHLERHKRYPADAQRQRQEGVVYVRFTLSRDGRVLALRLERAAGVASLDQEGLDLLQRAQPLPPFPPDQPGESMELVVPIQFYLKR
ncbi:energy transducer TonB [Reyranella sp.]|uniref:energy transducer TonB n=1 Tax=Reyranella sp. TaxID=1929291 RepID=UPI003D0EF0FB